MKLANILTTPLDENDAHADDDYVQMYQIKDIQTKEPVGKPSENRRSLRNKADKLDLEYGGVRYVVVRLKP